MTDKTTIYSPVAVKELKSIFLNNHDYVFFIVDIIKSIYKQ